MAPFLGGAYASTLDPDFGEHESITANSVEGGDIISDSLKRKADPFISLSGDQFVLDSSAGSVLTDYEYQLVADRIDQANLLIESADLGSNDTQVNYSDNATFTSYVDETPLPAARFKNGVNKIKVYWWGIRVWLSRNTVRAIGAGVTIAGIWIPEGVVSKVAATLGVVIALCPGGIRFDTNPVVAAIPLALKIWNVKFQ